MGCADPADMEIAASVDLQSTQWHAFRVSGQMCEDNHVRVFARAEQILPERFQIRTASDNPVTLSAERHPFATVFRQLARGDDLSVRVVCCKVH